MPKKITHEWPKTLSLRAPLWKREKYWKAYKQWEKPRNVHETNTVSGFVRSILDESVEALNKKENG